jgi:LytS/YehU family sensor histidine kinase
MESLRFDNSFTYNIHVEENINTETVLIPSMLIQPYVENAIWHGLLHKEDKGHLALQFSLSKNGSLKVIIEDNGVGREKASQLKSKQVLKKKSYGMQITENRIAIINEIMNINATMEIIDLKDDNGNANGTKVILNIPLQSLTQNN